MADDVAERVIEGLRGSRQRLLFSSTLAVVAYVGAKNGADVGLRQRFCSLPFVADTDLTCEETAGPLQITYVPYDMTEFITFRHQDAGYFVTFNGNKSLNKKASSTILIVATFDQ
ncbi:hypothetical protein MRX96_004509 [Rhipicephalus microplus]